MATTCLDDYPEPSDRLVGFFNGNSNPRLASQVAAENDHRDGKVLGSISEFLGRHACGEGIWGAPSQSSASCKSPMAKSSMNHQWRDLKISNSRIL